MPYDDENQNTNPFFSMCYRKTKYKNPSTSGFSANLPPMPENYLALLSSISFLVILSKCYLFLY